MRAIILSAGQGKRLLPLTESRPKCLLPVQGHRTVLDVQLRGLARCGVTEATVMVGFGAEQVEQHLAENPTPGLRVETFYNPFFKVSDNLITVWLARHLMADDFLLLNGDTLFDAPVLETLLSSPEAPLTIAINQKSSYDDDDMKVSLNGGRRLRSVGKTLDAEVVDGESIGLMLFRNSGVESFRGALEAAIRDPSSLSAWYLSVVNGMADAMHIETANISGLWWGEIDCPADLFEVRAFFDERDEKPPARTYAP
ncbi:MAG: phosphocholine cytidylyltransferase family protein [Proteobacteria bacterium]|nr:phosphocholine cytidylyltransferase family protein [Pseudomonadota bacterium]